MLWVGVQLAGFKENRGKLQVLVSFGCTAKADYRLTVCSILKRISSHGALGLRCPQRTDLRTVVREKLKTPSTTLTRPSVSFNLKRRLLKSYIQYSGLVCIRNFGKIRYNVTLLKSGSLAYV